MHDFDLKRLGLLMEPELGNPHEVGGVLNPAAARGPDGNLYLFPRLVGKNNYSRIGIARVKFNDAGDPCGVERRGIALEPEADYELQGDGRGGCEDARVTYEAALLFRRRHDFVEGTSANDSLPLTRARPDSAASPRTRRCRRKRGVSHGH